ncbi:hypothetical protein [Bartonella sp. LJL80]
MIKIVAVGLWVCLVALGTLMLGIKMNSVPSTATAATDTTPRIDYDRTDVISVPIMVNGKVNGYIISQLVYTVDANVKAKISVPLGLFVNDEVFRAFFGAYSDTREVERVKFDDVKKQIIDGVNQRFPEPVIKDLIVEQFNFISADQVREMNKQR